MADPTRSGTPNPHSDDEDDLGLSGIWDELGEEAEFIPDFSDRSEVVPYEAVQPELEDARSSELVSAETEGGYYDDLPAINYGVEDEPTEPEVPKRTRSKLRPLLIIAALLIVLGGGVAGVFFLGQQSAQDNGGTVAVSTPVAPENTAAGVTSSVPVQGSVPAEQLKELQAFVSEFAAVLNKRDADGYYNLFSKSQQADNGKVKAQAAIARLNPNANFTVVLTSAAVAGDRAQIKVDLGVIVGSSTQIQKSSINLIKESGQWRIAPIS